MKRHCLLLIVLLTLQLLSVSCAFPGTGNKNQNPPVEPATPTATKTILGVVVPTQTSEPNPCDRFSGNLELFIMAGPGEAVGLAPFAIGNFPINVTLESGRYLVSGGGPANYYDLLTADWGTYEVTMDLDIVVEGTCNSSIDSANLDLLVTMSGSQNVVVQSTGLSGEYPWNGKNTVSMILPILEGASTQGEGWQSILHIHP